MISNDGNGKGQMAINPQVKRAAFDKQPCEGCGYPYTHMLQCFEMVPSLVNVAKREIEGRGVPLWMVKVCFWCLRRERWLYTADKQWTRVEVAEGVPAPLAQQRKEDSPEQD